MRGILVSSTVIACTAALLATPSADATPPRATTPDRTGTQAAVAGSTQSLPLVPLAPDGHPDRTGPAELGLPVREVEPFSLVGIVWDDPRAELHGHAQVRTRAVGTHAWSAWQDVQTHDDDRPDPGTPEAGGGGPLHGSTAPLWVGASDAVQVRVRPEDPAAPAQAPRTQASPAPKGPAPKGRDPKAPAAKAPAAKAEAPQARAPQGPASKVQD
ncbi:N-acetylmuramoyl-L-alanine amidase, partial [Streptomyces sp. NPDC049577]